MPRVPIFLFIMMAVALTPRQGGAEPRLPGALPQVQQGSAGQQPLAKDEVMDLVDAGMDSAVLARKVEQLGINFEPTEEFLQLLSKAGASDVLIQALRNANPRPLSRQQVLKLLAGGVSSQRAAALVRQHGIDFMADDKYIHTLRVAGADDSLVEAVRAASDAQTAELVVVTSPGATVYVDGDAHGQTDAKGTLDLRARLGARAVKVSLAGKLDFSQTVTLNAGELTRLEAPLQDATAQAGASRQSSRDGLNYVWIPAGTFMMGCSSGDDHCLDDEKPAHSVTLTQGFWMGQTEITVAAYQRYAAASGHAMPPDAKFNARFLNQSWQDTSMPVIGVNWQDATDYCSWAGGRLPTEAEWEYAARGGTTGSRYGDVDDIAWTANNSGRTQLDTDTMWDKAYSTYFQKLDENGNGFHDVAQKRANPYNLFDILGNASEWVRDWYDAKYYQGSPSVDPAGPATGTQRVLRGWSWFNNAYAVRVSHRGPSDPTVQGNACGARCIMPTVP
jgi:formylglycine-generating enzyme required for sulfatase activity